MLKVSDLNYTIQRTPILQGISTAFKTNEISFIVGPNGAGKSTLIHLLSQQVMPASGTIEWGNVNIKNLPKPEMAKIRAVLSQSLELTFPLTVKEVVMMGRYPHFNQHPGAKDKEICHEVMRFFNIETMQERNYLTLSGGEKQRVHFARVAAQIWPDNSGFTKILLLDEPLTYLDIYYQHEFLQLVQQLMQQQPIIVIGVIHDLNLAYRFGNHITLLNHGKIIASGTPDEVLTPQNIKETFKIEPTVLTDQNNQNYLCF
tara:strand:- start:352 stop:1128 length:777 start_codon:yes stop_codon:yes gene_type:complete